MYPPDEAGVLVSGHVAGVVDRRRDGGKRRAAEVIVHVQHVREQGLRIQTCKPCKPCLSGNVVDTGMWAMFVSIFRYVFHLPCPTHSRAETAADTGMIVMFVPKFFNEKKIFANKSVPILLSNIVYMSDYRYNISTTSPWMRFPSCRAPSSCLPSWLSCALFSRQAWTKRLFLVKALFRIESRRYISGTFIR